MKILIVIVALLSLNIVSASYFYRTKWFPTCGCSEVKFETTFDSLAECEKSMCKNLRESKLPLTSSSKFFYRTEWYPLCSCSQVKFETTYSTLADCESIMCKGVPKKIIPKKYFYRDVWYPGCQCKQVEFESEFHTVEDCEKKMCSQTFFHRTSWWPSCGCTKVDFVSQFNIQSDCENTMCISKSGQELALKEIEFVRKFFKGVLKYCTTQKCSFKKFIATHQYLAYDLFNKTKKVKSTAQQQKFQQQVFFLTSNIFTQVLKACVSKDTKYKCTFTKFFAQHKSYLIALKNEIQSDLIQQATLLQSWDNPFGEENTMNQMEDQEEQISIDNSLRNFETNDGTSEPTAAEADDLNDMAAQEQQDSFELGQEERQIQEDNEMRENEQSMYSPPSSAYTPPSFSYSSAVSHAAYQSVQQYINQAQNESPEQVQNTISQINYLYSGWSSVNSIYSGINNMCSNDDIGDMTNQVSDNINANMNNLGWQDVGWQSPTMVGVTDDQLNGDFTPTNDMVKAGLWTIAGVAALDGGGEDPGEQAYQQESSMDAYQSYEGMPSEYSSLTNYCWSQALSDVKSALSSQDSSDTSSSDN